MKIKNDYPPNFKQIKSVFGDLKKHQPIFCYGDTIYNPWNRNITKDLEIHEEIHHKQQSISPELWWDKYLNDISFRLSQEIEAYGEQYKFIKKVIKDGGGNNKLERYMLESMAKALSGEIYGNMLTYSQAETKIRKYESRR